MMKKTKKLLLLVLSLMIAMATITLPTATVLADDALPTGFYNADTFDGVARFDEAGERIIPTGWTFTDRDGYTSVIDEALRLSRRSYNEPKGYAAETIVAVGTDGCRSENMILEFKVRKNAYKTSEVIVSGAGGILANIVLGEDKKVTFNNLGTKEEPNKGVSLSSTANYPINEFFTIKIAYNCTSNLMSAWVNGELVVDDIMGRSKTTRIQNVYFFISKYVNYYFDVDVDDFFVIDRNALESDADYVNAAKEKLTYRTLSTKESAAKILSDINLPTSAEDGVSISWESSDSETISVDADNQKGIVTRPSVTSPDKNVTLTATLSKNGETATKTFNVTVKSKALIYETDFSTTTMTDNASYTWGSWKMDTSTGGFVGTPIDKTWSTDKNNMLLKAIPTAANRSATYTLTLNGDTSYVPNRAISIKARVNPADQTKHTFTFAAYRGSNMKINSAYLTMSNDPDTGKNNVLAAGYSRKNANNAWETSWKEFSDVYKTAEWCDLEIIIYPDSTYSVFVDGNITMTKMTLYGKDDSQEDVNDLYITMGTIGDGTTFNTYYIDDFSVSYVPFAIYDENWGELSSPKDDTTGTIRLPLDFTAFEGKNAKTIVALMDENNKLIGMDVVTPEDAWCANIKYATPGDGKKLKVFSWDNNLAPLCNETIFE